MEQVVVKSEMQPNEEILLFYVDENGYNEDGGVITAENMEQITDDSIQQTVYIEQNPDDSDNDDLSQPDENEVEAVWTKYDSQRLLTFYSDNKETFIAGTTKRKFLWSVACKTMLQGKSPYSCEAHLNELMRNYAEALLNERRGIEGNWKAWPLLNLAQQVFHDDAALEGVIEQLNAQQETMETEAKPETESTVRKSINSRSMADQKVINMLNLYLKHKNMLKNVQKDFWQRGLWETIAMELGDDGDAEYWHKRFLNFKHNYIRLLEKRRDNPESVHWPYMSLFDQIFQNDPEFERRYKLPNVQILSDQTMQPSNAVNVENLWNDTEVTVLVKYYYDCFDEFQDPTIPKKFLWNEVGRLLDKNPELCKTKYEELKNNHFMKYINDRYDFPNRLPLDILFDNIISKETELELTKPLKQTDKEVEWTTEELDEMVQFICDYSDIFKDQICYYVCWAVVANKLKKSVPNCRRQIEDLVKLYRNILADKKEDPDMQIDWRYIELFDRIYDYGMDENLLAGYENLKSKENSDAKTAYGKPKQNNDSDPNGLDDDELDDKGLPTHSSRKAMKILEFYLKHKVKFSNARAKGLLWSQLGKEISLNPTQCAHKFRNIKQVYTRYVQQEIEKPEIPITWPCYQLCKKVFGYRELKNKLKNNKSDSDDSEEWSSQEIRQLIAYFAKHFTELSEQVNDLSIWADLSTEIGRSASACRNKFLDLRKSYRKLKTMKTKNPALKVNWKYFDSFDELYHYTSIEADDCEVMEVDEDNKGLQEDDDIQCIFVIPEGQDITDINNLPAIKEESEKEPTTETVKSTIKWSKKTKKRLLILYLNYVRSHRNKEIVASDMWNEIAAKLQNKTSLSCRKMFAKLKKSRLSVENDDEIKKRTPYYALLEKIIALKPKFKKQVSQNGAALSNEKVYKDVPMSSEKVLSALECYLQNLEEFVSPRFEKKYAWNNLAKTVGEPLNKIFNKINYLKNNVEENTPFTEVLKQIQAKESTISIDDVADDGSEESKVTDDTEVSWSDGETEQLLIWYLANLEKFKNPKFVRKYLWMESANILSKTPLTCSKKMSEIRTEYRNMVREKPDELNGWKFSELCQKIYGTGKQKA